MLSILIVTALAVWRCSRFIAAENFKSKNCGGFSKIKKEEKGVVGSS
jgi:hypothetical protein